MRAYMFQRRINKDKQSILILFNIFPTCLGPFLVHEAMGGNQPLKVHKCPPIQYIISHSIDKKSKYVDLFCKENIQYNILLKKGQILSRINYSLYCQWIADGRGPPHRDYAKIAFPHISPPPSVSPPKYDFLCIIALDGLMLYADRMRYKKDCLNGRRKLGKRLRGN